MSRALFLTALVACGGGLKPDGVQTGSQVACPGPGCPEVCDDEIDNDSDGYIDCNDLDCDAECDFDADGDGFDDIAAGGDDCNDADPAVNPGATEVCDDLDNDCDELVDEDDPDLDPASMIEWFIDADGDGYGVDGPSIFQCSAPTGAASSNDDCNDGDPQVFPGAFEQPGDCRDNDCDGVHGDTGCADFLYTVEIGTGTLRRLDTTTMTWTDIGPLGVTFSFGGLAYDEGSGVMYMVDGRGAESLYTVDVNTGAATLVGSHGINDLFGLAVTPSGDLFGTTYSPGTLYDMSATTGMGSLVGSMSWTGDGLTWDSTRGMLVALGGGSGELHEIDVTTGASVSLANQGWVNNCGLAYDSQNDLFWAIDYSGDLYTPTTPPTATCGPWSRAAWGPTTG